jgi:outer membrane protein TolC
MMGRIVLLMMTLGFLLTSFSESPAQESDAASPSLQALIDEALTHNPELEAARERWEMFRRKEFPAQTLSDPRLTFALSNYPVDTFSSDDTPMTGNDLRIDQAFPFPGKLKARGEAARQQALWYKGVYEDARLQLVMKVKDAWYRIFYQDRAIDVTQKNMALLDDFIRLTETRYEVGEGLQQDVLKAQIERSKLLDRLYTLQQERESLLAEFNRLLARPSATPLTVPKDIPEQRLEVNLEEIQGAAEEHRPLFASYRALIGQYQSQKKLAELDYKPDFNLFAGYRFRDDDLPDGGTDFLSAGISINLPVWREKRSEQVAEADSGIRMARSQFEDFRHQVQSRVHDAYARVEKNRTLVELFDSGILPQARQTFEASLAAYQVGDVDFLSLLDSLMTLYRYEMDYFRAVSDHRRALAVLEAASGRTVPAEQ